MTLKSDWVPLIGQEMGSVEERWALKERIARISFHLPPPVHTKKISFPSYCFCPQKRVAGVFA